METNQKKIQDIHNYLIHTQGRKMVDKIDDYGLYDFFNDYKEFLKNLCPSNDSVLFYFSTCVISYHRIISNKTKSIYNKSVPDRDVR